MAAPEQTLKEAGLRVTRQRLAVLDALKDRPESLSAQDLYLEFRARGESIGLSTVYRALTSLEEAGLLDGFTRNGEQTFRYCSPSHHHHLICISCNQVEELQAEVVEDWVSRVSKSHDFRVTGHRADVFGECAACQRASRAQDN